MISTLPVYILAHSEPAGPGGTLMQPWRCSTIRPVFERRAALLLACLAAAGCGVTVKAQNPYPNVLAAGRVPATVYIDTSGIAYGKICTQSSSLKDVCIEDLKPAMHNGLNKLLSQYMSPSQDEHAEYGAFLRVIDISISASGGGKSVTGLLMMRWQFQLLKLDGTVVAQVAEATTSPLALLTLGDAQNAVQSLLNTIMERIAGLLNESSLLHPPVATPPPPVPETVGPPGYEPADPTPEGTGEDPFAPEPI